LPENSRFPKVIVNQTALTALGFTSPQEALGKRFWAGINGWHPEIVGEVKDFNVGSLHEEIKPTMLSVHFYYVNKVSIKIAAGANVAETLGNMSSAFKTVYPKGVFEFNFLDQSLDALYKAEAKLY